MTVSCENAALVPASARNRPSFTSVHSHAPAPKSSGAFFMGMGRERCRKRPSGRRNALRASEEVRARDVMVNRNSGSITPKKTVKLFAYILRHTSYLSCTAPEPLCAQLPHGGAFFDQKTPLEEKMTAVSG